ncbi:hypothetical protein CQ10_29485 [Bradyrhizobium valentinum]|nr:hypothetical protein CQ10_29485 [Bradyrhizobium valentinum]
MAHAKNVQVAAEPQMTPAGGLQADRAPPEENKAFSWIRRLPDTTVPSSWIGGWEGERKWRRRFILQLVCKSRHKMPAGGSRRPAIAVHKSRPHSPKTSSSCVAENP